MVLQELYLDTHVLVWLYDQGAQGFTSQTLGHLESAEKLLISPMVALEIEFLFEIEKITQPSSIIVHYLSENLGLSVCAKPFPSVAVQAMDIKWTRDPFDRLITAQAGLDRSPLLTKDRIIHDNYQHAIWS